jgi:hypothetical protein
MTINLSQILTAAKRKISCHSHRTNVDAKFKTRLPNPYNVFNNTIIPNSKQGTNRFDRFYKIHTRFSFVTHLYKIHACCSGGNEIMKGTTAVIRLNIHTTAAVISLIQITKGTCMLKLQILVTGGGGEARSDMRPAMRNIDEAAAVGRR